MAPSELIERLSAAGCRLRADGEQLRVHDPKRILTDDLRQAIREHKPELLRLLRSEPANDTPAPCPTCGDPERWPTTRGPVCPTCWLAASVPTPAPEWIAEQNLDPESIAEAFPRYLAETSGGTLPDWPQGQLLSQFTLWLEAQGERPTTLPVLRQALRMPAARTENRPSYLAICSGCGGAQWGPTGRHTEDGAEVWCCCRTCAAKGDVPRW